MTPTSHDRLLRTVERCGSFLATAAPGRITIDGDPVSFYAPVLGSGLRLEGLDLDELPAALYSVSDVTYGKVEYVWRWLCENFRDSEHRHLSADMIRSIYPDLPLLRGNTYEARTMNMVQFIKAASWSFGDLQLDVDHCLLALGARTFIGFRGQSVEYTRDGYRRHPERYVPDYAAALRQPIGHRRVSTPRTTAVYIHLLQRFPLWDRALQQIFGAAVHAGPDFEARFTRNFTVVTDLQRLELQ